MAALAVVTLTSFGLAGFMFYTYRSQQRQLQELLRSKARIAWLCDSLAGPRRPADSDEEHVMRSR